MPNAPPDPEAAQRNPKLQLAGVPTLSAEELLARMQARVIALRQERTRQVDERRRQNPAADKVNKRPFQKRIR